MKAARYYIFLVTGSILIGMLSSGSSTASDEVSTGLLKVAEIFNDHMVLQRDQRINIWGSAAPNETVSLNFISRTYETTADGSGHWKITILPVPAGGPYEMEITDGTTGIRFQDIYMGDVWLASGQSNMAFRLKSASDPEKETLARDAAKYNIRMYDVAKVVARGKLLNETNKPWAQADPDNVYEWSAVAFYFARGLYEHLNIPIGIINCNQGGSRIEAWMRADVLKEAAVPKREFSGIFRAYKNPSVLYEGMLSEIIPYTLKGVIWYQGEANTDDADAYQKLLSALIRQWRTEWNQDDLPFLFAQLPGFQRKEDKTGESWAVFRKAQEAVAKSEPHTGMVVIIDAGDKNDIHPTNKKVVGERFVLAARAVAYDEDIDYSGPTVKEIRYNGKGAVISYDHAGEGLIAKGDEVQGFFVQDKEGNWYPAQARIRNKQVRVSYPKVKEVVAVRYAWVNAPEANLYNRRNLPAAPFKHMKEDN